MEGARSTFLSTCHLDSFEVDTPKSLNSPTLFTSDAVSSQSDLHIPARRCRVNYTMRVSVHAAFRVITSARTSWPLLQTPRCFSTTLPTRSTGASHNAWAGHKGPGGFDLRSTDIYANKHVHARPYEHADSVQVTLPPRRRRLCWRLSSPAPYSTMSSKRIPRLLTLRPTSPP